MVARPEQDSMELVRSVRYQVGVDQDITAVILQHGWFEHVIGGPGLTADVLKIPGRSASTGRLYFIYTNETENIIEWLSTGGHMTHVTNSPLRNLFVEKNDEYAVSVIKPADYGLQDFRREDVRLLDTDCLMKFFEMNIDKGISSDGTYIFKPKDLEQDKVAKIINHHPKMTKFAQIYFKAYARLGMEVDDEARRHIWRWICAKQHDPVSANDQIKYANWITELSTAPISEML
jgi:hypothetical protein